MVVAANAVPVTGISFDATDHQVVTTVSSTSNHAADLPTSPIVQIQPTQPVTIEDGGTAEIVGASAQSVTFTGTTGTLKLDDASAFTGVVSGLTGADAIDLAEISYGANTKATFSGNANGGTVTVTNGIQTANIALAGDYLTSGWTLASDGHGGTVVVDPPLLPSGVTLQPINGGPNYFANNGLTFAANAGWDNPSFFPIGPFDEDLTSQSVANVWNALGWNTAWGLAGDSVISVADANRISVLQGTNAPLLPGTGAETVGLFTQDEPQTFAAGVSTPISTTPNSVQDGRFWYVNDTWNFIEYGPPGGTPAPGTQNTFLTYPVATPDGSTRHIDASSIDVYWFAGAVGTGAFNASLLMGVSNATADQIARGSNYGDVITKEESYTGGTQPIYALIETGGPYTEDTTGSSYITPPELNWAVWSSLIHGANGIDYFDHSFGGPAQSDSNVQDSYYQTVQPGQTVSIYTQIQNTDALVEQLAPVLNSPTAMGYVTVNNAGYENGQIISEFSGIETMAKDYNGQFYIFADTRDSLTQTNIPATFTVADPNATSVTVVGENRTIPVVNGVFTDTFATAATVHIYEVNDGNPAPVISTGLENSNASVTLTGTAPNGATVTVSDNGGATTLGTATASSTGSWSFTTAALAAGSYAFTATDTTSAGTSAASSPFNVLVTNPANPAVSSIVESPSSGDLNAGKTVTLTLNFNEVVTVTGTPTLTLNDGGTATYTSGSNSSALTFSYTVAAGQNTSALAVTSVNLPTGASIKNSAGAVAQPSLSGLTQTGPQIDTTAPAAPVISGDTVNVNTVTLTGTAEANSTITVFDNTTQLGTATTNSSGAWTYTTGALANGSQSFTATATDGAGNVSPLSSALVMTLTAPVNLVANGSFETNSFTGWTLGGNDAPLAAGPQIYINQSAESGTYAAAMGSMGSDGTLSQTIATTPGQQYTLSFWLQNGASGTNDFTAIWNGQKLLALTNAAQSGYTEYTYTVTATGSTSTLQFAARNDPSHWNLDNISLTAAGTTTPTPTVSSLTESPSSGDLNAGKTVTLTLTMSGAVTVNTTGGSPTLTLNDGGTATYSGGSGSSALTFSYTVAAGQNTASLAATAVNLNGATIKDGSGNAANLSLSGLTQIGPQIGTVTPTISSIAESPSSGVLNAGKTVTLTLTMNEAVTVSGTPQLMLNDGGIATYTGGSGTSALTFKYTVLAGQNTPDLQVTAVNLNGGTIKDGAGNAANLSLAGITQGSPAIDTTAPAAPVISGDTVSGNTVTLTGTAEANSTITVFDNTTQLGTASTNSSGAWTYTTGALANGSQSFTATATDGAGNVSPLSSALAMTLTAPVNLVANGSFETNSFTGWTLGSNNAPLAIGPQIYINTSAESGTYAAAMGSVGSDGTLSQTIATTAGQQYTLSFWLKNGASGTNDFTALWNGQKLLALTNAAQSGYTEYTYTVTATGSTSTLQFAARNDPSHWNLDNISVTAMGATTPTPTPTSIVADRVPLDRRSQCRQHRHADADHERGGDGQHHRRLADALPQRRRHRHLCQRLGQQCADLQLHRRRQRQERGIAIGDRYQSQRRDHQRRCRQCRQPVALRIDPDRAADRHDDNTADLVDCGDTLKRRAQRWQDGYLHHHHERGGDGHRHAATDAQRRRYRHLHGRLRYQRTDLQLHRAGRSEYPRPDGDGGQSQRGHDQRRCRQCRQPVVGRHRPG